MEMTVPGWTVLAEDPPVLVKEYAFGAGRANALATRLPDRSWMIMSPSLQLSDAEAQAFTERGGVSALLENNGAHHMGLGPWRAKFPQAVTYAAPRAAARIRKKSRDAGQLEPIEKLQPKLGDKVAAVAIAGDKIGDVCLRVQTEKGALFYAGDFFANLPKLPSNLLARLAFRLTDSAPGLKVFSLFFKFYVANKGAAAECLIRELTAHPPVILVPAHGGVVESRELASTLIKMLGAVR